MDTTAPPTSVIPRSTVTVVSKAVLQGVSHLPRRHLGSMLYSPHLTVSPSSRRSKFAYVTTPTPLPRFYGRENCTFTIRVPKQFLTSGCREELVRRRALWGSDVYTDDSDILAVAVHMGWIRGAWSDEVDISLLDLGPDSPGACKKGRKDVGRAPAHTTTTYPWILNAPPDGGPIVPPPHKDLHLTLLILPPLESYASTVSRGLRSRAWGKDHDGMSFRIERIEWVDHASTHCEERGGKARRERLEGLRQAHRGLQEAVTLKDSGDAARSTGWNIEVVG